MAKRALPAHIVTKKLSKTDLQVECLVAHRASPRKGSSADRETAVPRGQASGELLTLGLVPARRARRLQMALGGSCSIGPCPGGPAQRLPGEERQVGWLHAPWYKLTEMVGHLGQAMHLL